MSDYQITEKNVTNKQQELVETSNNEDAMVPSLGEKILVVRRGMDNVNFDGIMAKVSQYVDLAQTVSQIKKAKEYVVKIPLQHQAGFDKGKLFLNENKNSGVLWPTLMEKGSDGRNKFVGNLPIQERGVVSGNPFKDISTNMYNIALQNQIQDVVVTVEKLYKGVQRIEHGQADDRKGLLNSGKEQIVLALSYDDEDEKNRAIALGVRDLITAKNQIGETLKRRVLEFEPVPDGWFKQRAMVFKDAQYLKDKDKEIQEIQEYYALYLEATKLISTSLLIKGEKEAANLQFEASKDFISTIPFKSLKSIEHAHQNNDLTHMFFYHPVEYIEVEQEESEEQARDYDYVLLETTGKELLEAVGNEEKTF